MAAWLRNSADKARAALATAGENVGRRVGLEDYDSLFHNDPETGYAVRSVALLREDTKSLQAALEKYKRAVETSVQGGVLELGLKGFSQALIEIASRDSIKARRAHPAAQPAAKAIDSTPPSPAGAQQGRCVTPRRHRGARAPRLTQPRSCHASQFWSFAKTTRWRT